MRIQNGCHPLPTPDPRSANSRLTESLRQKLLAPEVKRFEKQEREIIHVDKASRSMQTRLRLLERRLRIFCENADNLGHSNESLASIYTHPTTKTTFTPPSQDATQAMELQVKMRQIKQVFGHIPSILTKLNSLARLQKTFAKFEGTILEIMTISVTSARSRAHPDYAASSALFQLKAGIQRVAAVRESRSRLWNGSSA